MTVTCVEVVMAKSHDPSRPVGSPAPPELPNVVPDRVQQHVLDVHSEVLADDAAPAATVPRDPSPDDDLEYVRLRRRHPSSEAVSDIVDSYKEVVKDAEWAEIRVHDCTHDEAEPEPCPDSTVKYSHGSIPEGV